MRSPGRLGANSATDHRIEFELGTTPIRSMAYGQGLALRDKTSQEIRRMPDDGVVEPATSEWALPVVLVANKDGSLRFCVDYRRLNAKKGADPYPLPRIEDFVDSLRLIYLDDFIVFSNTIGEQLGHVDHVHTLRRQAGVTRKMKKCAFLQSKVDYLGHLFMPGILALARETIQAFEHVPDEHHADTLVPWGGERVSPIH